MNANLIMYVLGGAGILFILIVMAFLMLKRKMNTSEIKQIQQLREGTEAKSFSTEVLFQKLYIFYLKTPFLKKYLLKVRRRLAIINVDDEYLTRKQAASILTKTLCIILPLTIVIIAMTHENTLLLCILLLLSMCQCTVSPLRSRITTFLRECLEVPGGDLLPLRRCFQMQTSGAPSRIHWC